MNWLGAGVLANAGKGKKKYLSQYAEIAKGFISDERMEQLIGKGLIGNIPKEVVAKKAAEKAKEDSKAEKE